MFRADETDMDAPYEVFFAHDEEIGRKVFVWFFPKENCHRIYLDGHHYDTIYGNDTIVLAKELAELPELPRFNMENKRGEESC